MRTTHTLRAVLALGASISALVTATAALAAETEGENTIEAIVVTAQRREETANTIGMAIQAFSGDTLDQLHVNDVKDLSSVVPSFSASRATVRRVCASSSWSRMP